MDRVKDLVMELSEASFLYYYTGKESMPNEIFDLKKEELRKLDPENPFFSLVGAEGIPDKEKVDLEYQMFSTDKSLSLKELQPFWNRVFGWKSIIISNKVDGLAVNLVYEEGCLVLASTRGNGKVGRSFTGKVSMMPIPKVLREKFSGKVRGEIYLTYQNFAILNEILEEEGSELQDNCRNSAAGLINAGLSEIKNAERKLALLSFRAYGVYEEGTETDEFGSYSLYEDQLVKATDLGFNTVEWKEFHYEKEITDFLLTAKEWLEKFDFPCDGVVLRVNDQAFARKKGTAKNYLNAVTAFKFEPEMVLATVKNILWQQGSVEYTPRIEIEPVELGGARVSYVSGHSVKNLIDIGAYPGEKIALVRSGEVIPRAYNRKVYDEKKLLEGVVC